MVGSSSEVRLAEPLRRPASALAPAMDTDTAQTDARTAVVAPSAAYPFSLSIVIPAYNEGPRVGSIVRTVRARYPDAEIIVVDDASTDDTAAQAAQASADVIRRPYNVGNGAGVRTGIRAAHGDVVVVLDADGQHDPASIGRLLAHMDHYDMVIAARPDRASQETTLRYLGNRALNAFSSYLVELDIKDLTSGFRALRREAMLEFLHVLPNQYGWTVASALAFAKSGYHLHFEPVTMHKRQGGQSQQRLLRNGIKKGLISLRIVSLFAPLRVYLPIALSMLVLSLVSFLISFFITDPWRLHIPNSAVGLFVGAIMVFLYGLQAEQIAALRFRDPDATHQTARGPHDRRV